MRRDNLQLLIVVALCFCLTRFVSAGQPSASERLKRIAKREEEILNTIERIDTLRAQYRTYQQERKSTGESLRRYNANVEVDREKYQAKMSQVINLNKERKKLEESRGWSNSDDIDLKIADIDGSVRGLRAAADESAQSITMYQANANDANTKLIDLDMKLYDTKAALRAIAADPENAKRKLLAEYSRVSREGDALMQGLSGDEKDALFQDPAILRMAGRREISDKPGAKKDTVDDFLGDTSETDASGDASSPKPKFVEESQVSPEQAETVSVQAEDFKIIKAGIETEIIPYLKKSYNRIRNVVRISVEIEQNRERRTLIGQEALSFLIKHGYCYHVAGVGFVTTAKYDEMTKAKEAEKAVSSNKPHIPELRPASPPVIKPVSRPTLPKQASTVSDPDDLYDGLEKRGD